MKQVYLIRHGETEFNRLNIKQGSKHDIPLNYTGKEQALYTGKYIQDYILVLSSPMKRAKETAEIICKEIDYDLDNIRYYDELIELDDDIITDNIISRIEKILYIIKTSIENKIFIVVHIRIINSITNILFNANPYKYKNCSITYLTYDNILDKFSIVMIDDTSHFALYDKN
jgi:phosphohistidine phosphatase SixA